MYDARDKIIAINQKLLNRIADEFIMINDDDKSFYNMNY